MFAVTDATKEPEYKYITAEDIDTYGDGLEKERAPTMEEWMDEFFRYWASIIVMFVPFIKHPKFKGEREWRLVYHLQDEAIPCMKYLQRNSMITKHVPLRVMLQNDKPRLPITGVVVGSSSYKEISRVSVGDLLPTYGYSTNEMPPVRTTDIPYRLVEIGHGQTRPTILRRHDALRRSCKLRTSR